LLYDPYTTGLLGACFVDDVWFCRYFDPQLTRVQQRFEATFADSAIVRFSSFSQDRKRIVITTRGPRNPGAYFLYDAAKDSMNAIGKARPDLPAKELGDMLVVKYPARDGTKIPAYLTMPPGKGDKNLPLVVMPHGGPELRDYVDFDPWAQMLASRGFAVLQPNFRGSGGYGKSFTEAGHRQWGRLMQDDITDGVTALVKDGTADPNRVCIVGASYGGYAALAGGAFTPDLYKCVMSISGVSDVIKMIEEDRYHAGSDSYIYDYWKKWVGDPRSADAEQMKAISPINHAAKFKAPVLLVHGDQDNNVRSSQSIAMQKALKKAGKQVELVLVPEGHTFVSIASRKTLLTEMERFVTAHIGK
jgi:dipeptidyl aminopeptidase/acylaminoacyl peptidase